MSIFHITLVLGAAATFLFFIGLKRGAVAAIRDADKTVDENQTVEDGGYAWTAIAAVVASSSIVTLAGTSPIFIYFGPLLAIGSAAAMGIAFLVEDRK
ncbi:hypothetical protein [Mesorhizobium sp.]|uniref:hypothetical protein n=1 Tax=Mesorhizobium sp. TaxID=1871066 RepID=UPI000FE66C02|nr:hypothetical protein [Mesorhizobium sp.]RWI16780.1 MAG: hypothetical protein EOQ94_29575 [Mesorhizobium sp.]RWN08729.1 MAG: hypothetical protein EOR87_20900 [Mesorhizobium sp.]RWN16155.1 MAG: hypothetical protein EOR88_16835 [Mesorhizobium sp.]TIQ97543.1 MAG: hypothetical protein E5X36_13435 [Mesorhizobium sp.]